MRCLRESNFFEKCCLEYDMPCAAQCGRDPFDVLTSTGKGCNVQENPFKANSVSREIRRTLNPHLVLDVEGHDVGEVIHLHVSLLCEIVETRQR